MKFDDLATGESVFLDANTFVYHFAPDPVFGMACSRLLERIENGELQGFTSTHILSEVSHRLMTIEASTLFGWPFAGIVYRLQKSPADVQKLTSSKVAIDKILGSTVQTLSIPPALMSIAPALSQSTGLLTNDALLVAVMQANHLKSLASNDTDFDRVTGIVRYGRG
jgi:predicted nucleic acid-binding protein